AATSPGARPATERPGSTRRVQTWGCDMTSTETIPPSATDAMTDDMNDDMRSIYMSTKTEPLRQALLEHLPVRERIELIPVHEILERLPVQDVIERLPQRFRPEPPKKKSRMK